jgi:hypothetical protein
MTAYYWFNEETNKNALKERLVLALFIAMDFKPIAMIISLFAIFLSCEWHWHQTCPSGCPLRGRHLSLPKAGSHHNPVR